MTESDLVHGIIAVKRQWKASGEGTPSGTGGEGGRGDLTGTLHTPPVHPDCPICECERDTGQVVCMEHHPQGSGVEDPENLKMGIERTRRFYADLHQRLREQRIDSDTVKSVVLLHDVHISGVTYKRGEEFSPQAPSYFTKNGKTFNLCFGHGDFWPLHVGEDIRVIYHAESIP